MRSIRDRPRTSVINVRTVLRDLVRRILNWRLLAAVLVLLGLEASAWLPHPQFWSTADVRVAGLFLVGGAGLLAVWRWPSPLPGGLRRSWWLLGFWATGCGMMVMTVNPDVHAAMYQRGGSEAGVVFAASSLYVYLVAVAGASLTAVGAVVWALTRLLAVFGLTEWWDRLWRAMNEEPPLSRIMRRKDQHR
jgi:hypothetical protein